MTSKPPSPGTPPHTTGELTRLMIAAGYDAVDVTSDGDAWHVLLDPALIATAGEKPKRKKAVAP